MLLAWSCKLDRQEEFFIFTLCTLVIMPMASRSWTATLQLMRVIHAAHTRTSLSVAAEAGAYTRK